MSRLAAGSSRLIFARTMVAAGALTTLGALPVFLLSAQSVFIASELRVTEAQLGALVGAFFASAALASMLWGSIFERLGRRVSTILAASLAAVSALGISTAASAYLGLLVLMTIAGTANAGFQMSSNLTLAESLPPHRQGLGYGFKQSAIPLAILIGGITVPTVAVTLGWRWTFGAAGACALVVVLITAGTRIREPVAVAPAPGLDRAPRNALVVVFVGMTLASGAANSLGAFLPAWAFEVGMSPASVGLLLAAGSILSIIVRVLSGMAADRRNGRNFPVVAAQLVIGSAGLCLLATADIDLIVAGALVAFAIGWGWPGLLIFAVVRVARDRPATASGAVQGGAFAGGASGPFLFGLLVSTTNYQTAWLAAALVMIVSAAVVAGAGRIFRADLQLRPPQRPLKEKYGRSAGG